MSLPSPRTLKQAQRELIINAMDCMDEEQFQLFYREVGPYCLERILDATQAKPAEPAPQPRRQQAVQRVSDDESAQLIEQLRDILGADGWDAGNLSEIFSGQGGKKTVGHLLNGGLKHPLTIRQAQQAKAFLEGK